MILDEATLVAVHTALTTSRTYGLDPAEHLHHKGLLLDPATRRHIQAEALSALLEEMQRWEPHEYLRRITKTAAATPKDMYDAVLGFIQDYVNATRNQSL